MMCGGVGKAQAATAETQQIAQEVKAQVEARTGRAFDVFRAVQFKTQLVAGVNYFIKVHVGDEEYLHLRVFRSLPAQSEEPPPLALTSYQSNKGQHEELLYF